MKVIAFYKMTVDEIAQQIKVQIYVVVPPKTPIQQDTASLQYLVELEFLKGRLFINKL